MDVALVTKSSVSMLLSFIHSSHSLEKGAGRMLQTEQGQRSHPAYHGSLCGKGRSRFPKALQKAGIYSTRVPRL